jgi:hypothetical protein
MRMPLATSTFVHAGDLAGLLHQGDQRPVVGPQQLADFGMHARLPPTDRLDFGAVHFISYMFAVGPPMSLTTPLNSASGRHASNLGQDRFLAAGLDDRPWCAVIEQNVQPPKQPRMIVTESLIISKAGIGSV